MSLTIKAKLALTPMFKEIEYLGKKEGRECFDVRPAALYNAALTDAVKTIATGEGWTNVIWLNQAIVSLGALPSTGYCWELVKPKSDVNPKDHQLRAETLNYLRLWFTEKLHTLVNHKHMYLHIIIKEPKDADWRY